MSFELKYRIGMIKRAGWGVSALLASAMFLLPNASAQLPYPQGNADYAYMHDGYQVWVFTNTAAATSWSVPSGVTQADILIVGGGGAGVGGASFNLDARGGGGGAGGVLFLEDFNTSQSSYSITIGAGGASSAANGENTVFGSHTAIGGGGGGGGDDAATREGRVGGSGGGGSGLNGSWPGGAGTGSQGMAGGSGFNANSGGGGGGYLEEGENAPSGTVGGKGGDGFDASAYFGTNIGDNGWFAGGGGGSGSSVANSGVGGQGGGGRGEPNDKGEDGMAATGGGGGGVRNIAAGTPVPGFGGSGAVVIRVELKLLFPTGTADSSYIFGNYQVWVYNSGPKNWTPPVGVTQADILVVAGGGAGGFSALARGGGGGGGGVIFEQDYELTLASYSLTVGAGGVSAGGNSLAGTENGENSAFGSLTAIGGGAGGFRHKDPERFGADGGSGGGGSGRSGSWAGGNGTSGQGMGGGSGLDGSTKQAGGGGGGYSEAGQDAYGTGIGGKGGDGFDASAYFGIGIGDDGWFAGGGGGAHGGSGGLGGGADGRSSTSTGSAASGMSNTGGGGGGYPATTGTENHHGGSGIVLIRATLPANWSPLTDVTRNTPDPDNMDVTLQWEAVPGNDYEVYASTTLPGGWTLIDEVEADAATETFDVNEYATSAAPHRYFQVTRPGFPVSNVNPWGVINVPIEPGMNLIGVPVWLAETGINLNLNGASSLGALLAGMLHSSDKLHIWTWSGSEFYWEELVRDGNTWERPSNQPPTLSTLEAGRAFFVERVENSSTYLTFVAPVGNRDNRSIDIDEGWNPISLSEGRPLTVQNAFNNLAVGSPSPQGSGNPRLADRVIEIRPNGTAAILSRQADGNWLLTDQSGQSNGNGYILQPGRAYFYERKAVTTMQVQF
jgi:hypothetical protein